MAKVVTIRTFGGRYSVVTFRTNAAWEQRVHIQGTGVNKTLTGSGENRVHWALNLGNRPGSFLVRAWYKSPGSGAWQESDGKVFGILHPAARGMRAGFNDGGGDQDYNDADVSVVSYGLPFKLEGAVDGLTIDEPGSEVFTADTSAILNIKP